MKDQNRTLFEYTDTEDWQSFWLIKVQMCFKQLQALVMQGVRFSNSAIGFSESYMIRDWAKLCRLEYSEMF